MSYKFTAVITKEKKWYVIRCVELGVVTQSKTLEEAQKNIKEAVELYLKGEVNIKDFVSDKSPLVTTFEISHV